MRYYIVTLGDQFGSIRVYRVHAATQDTACRQGIARAKAEEDGDWYVSACREV